MACDKDMDHSNHERLNQFITPEKATSTPLLKDLLCYITPNYAADWRMIGTLLSIPSGILEIIKYNNHDKAEPCCDAVLKKWLEVNPSASWEKLLKVIESPAMSSDQAPDKVTSMDKSVVTDQEVSILSDGVRQLNRFAVDKDAWPPNRPQSYTPLLVHHKDQHFNKPAVALQLAECVQSDIFYSKHYPQDSLKEALNNSKTTKQLVDILAPLQESDDVQFILIEGLPGIGKSQIAYNLQAWFRIDGEIWLINQLKNFTPLVLIHYEGHHNLHLAVAATELAHTGDIASLASDQPVPKRLKLDSYHPLPEVLNTITVTKEVTQACLLVKTGEPKVILVEGPPGIGKSVLLKEIAHWWDVELILKLSEFVCLCEQQIASSNNLLQLLCVGHEGAPEITGTCNYPISKNGNKDIVFFFDGFDKFPVELKKSFKILKYNVLPKSGLIESFRPHALDNLHKQTTLRVDSLGFTEVESINFIQQAYTVKELTEYFEDNLTTDGMCYIPFTMVYLCKQGIAVPSNSPQLYNYFICLNIYRHHVKSGHSLDNTTIDLVKLPEPYKSIVHQLSKLLLEGVSNSKPVFTLEEITAVCPNIVAYPDNFSLLQDIWHFEITGRLMTFSFFSISIQEFLAACHITWLLPAEDLQLLKETFWSNLLSNMFTIFMLFARGQRSACKYFLYGGKDTTTISEIFLKEQLQHLNLFCSFHVAGDFKISYIQLPDCNQHSNCNLRQHIDYQNQHSVHNQSQCSDNCNQRSDDQSHPNDHGGHQDDVKESIDTNESSMDLLRFWQSLNFLLCILMRCFGGGGGCNLDMFRTMSMRQRFHEEITKEVECDKTNKSSRQVFITTPFLTYVCGTKPVATLLWLLTNEGGDDISCEDDEPGVCGSVSDVHLKLKELLNCKQHYKHRDIKTVLVYFLSLCSVVWYLSIDLDDNDVTLSHDLRCPYFDAVFHESRNFSSFNFHCHLDNVTPDNQKNKSKTLLFYFISFSSVTNGVQLSAMDLDDDDRGCPHFDVIFHGATNLSIFYLHHYLDDATHDFQKFSKDKFNFKFVCFAVIVATALVTDYDHCHHSLVTTKTSFQRFTSAHETLPKQCFLNSMKKKVYRDFMYFSIPCLVLEFVHYLPTDNHGMFKRLHDLEHYSGHLSHHLKKSSTADMSDIAKFEHCKTTDDHYNGVLSYTYITSDHRLVASGPEIMSHIVKESSISPISQLFTTLLICTVVLCTFYQLPQVPSIMTPVLSKYDIFQWLSMHPANLCDRGDGSSTCSFTCKGNCIVSHWHLVDSTSISLHQKINNTTNHLIDRSFMNSLILNFYQAVNSLPSLSSVVNILWCSSSHIVHVIYDKIVKLVNDILTVVCGQLCVTHHGITTGRPTALHTDVQECIVQQHCYDISTACLVTGKEISKSTLNHLNTTYTFTSERSSSATDTTGGIECEDDVELEDCVEEVHDHQCSHPSASDRNASHSFETHKPSMFTCFFSEHPISHVDAVQLDIEVCGIAEECSDDEPTGAGPSGIVQEEVTGSLENSTSLACYEVPECVPVSESCHDGGDHLTILYPHFSNGIDDNSDDDIDNDDRVIDDVVDDVVDDDHDVDDSCDADKVDDGDDEDFTNQSSQPTLNKSICDGNYISNFYLEFVDFIPQSYPPQEYDDQRSELTIPSSTIPSLTIPSLAIPSLAIPTLNKSICDGNYISNFYLEFVDFIPQSYPPQEYDDQRSELTIPTPSLTRDHTFYQPFHHIFNDVLRPIGDTNKPQPSHTDQPAQFEGTTADRDGGQPKPVQTPSINAHLPSDVVPDGKPVVQASLPHSLRKTTVRDDTHVEKDLAQHDTYVEKDGRLQDAVVNISATAFSHVGGTIGFDAQLISEQPRQLEHLPDPGPHYDYLYDTKFEEDVPVSYEEVKQRTNVKTTFLQHEIEERSHKPTKPHHNTQQPQHLPTAPAAGVVKTKTLPKRSCIVIGDKQFPLDPNLLAHPHMDQYFVKDRTEMKPGHFLARLTLHHHYLDKLNSSEVTTAAQRSQAAIAVADSAVEKDGAVTEQRHFPLNVNRTGYVVFSSDSTRFTGDKKYPLPSRKAAAVKLGKGGNGFVFSIFHNGKEYAVKKTVYRPSEIRVHSQLAHANLVNLDAVLMGEEHERHRGKFYAFCFMTKMDMDFRSVISTKEHGCLKHLKLQLVEQRNLWEVVMVNVKYVLRSVLKALDYMHNQGLVHRDVKASNILLKMRCQCTKPLMCACPQKYSVKLGDFDSSTTVPGYGLRIEPHQMIRYASVLPLGTMGYRAPEVSMHLVISGPYEVLYTTGVDIWSFGCLLLNMLIGKAGPLKQRGEAALLLSAQDEPYSEELYNKIIKVKELQKYYSDVPELVDLVRKCLQVEVHCRPTAKQLLQLDMMKC